MANSNRDTSRVCAGAFDEALSAIAGPHPGTSSRSLWSRGVDLSFEAELPACLPIYLMISQRILSPGSGTIGVDNELIVATLFHGFWRGAPIGWNRHAPANTRLWAGINGELNVFCCELHLFTVWVRRQAESDIMHCLSSRMLGDPLFPHSRSERVHQLDDQNQSGCYIVDRYWFSWA